MLTPKEIIELGEEHVSRYLKGTGYYCTLSKPHHGAADIDARGEDDNLVVHVMTALHPAEVPNLTPSDRARVVSRAMSLEYDAWLAKVVINTEGEMLGDIVWEQLNH
ncbi:MAG: hypothetical protein JNJ83_09115 [Verrucomicrobiaceae bacterium]|nr:hypothetical protein [Verrucomicrobiaceae bacterium]